MAGRIGDRAAAAERVIERVDRVIHRRSAFVKQLDAHIALLNRNRFGARSEKLDPDQLNLGLEDAEQERAAVAAEADAKLNAVDPLAYLTAVLDALAAGHPINRIAELLPWRWAITRSDPKLAT